MRKALWVDVSLVNLVSRAGSMEPKAPQSMIAKRAPTLHPMLSVVFAETLPSSVIKNFCGKKKLDES